MSNSRKNGTHQVSTASKNGNRASTPMRSGGTAVAPAPVKPSIPVQSRPVPVPAQPARKEVSRQAIAEAAYFLWLQRGGNEVSNWLDAETMLRSRKVA